MKLVAGFCVLMIAGCAATTSGGSAAGVDEARIRQLEALQTKNPDWRVQLDDAGHVVATTKTVSMMRDDIRPEVDTFARASATELGLDQPGTKRVAYEPEHVRYERGGAVVEARLRDGTIVVMAPLAR